VSGLLAFGPIGIPLGRTPDGSLVEIAALLNVARMRGYSGVANSQKRFLRYPGQLKAVEILRPYFLEDSLYRASDLCGSGRSQEHYFDFTRHEEEIPPRGMYLSSEGRTVHSPDDAPAHGVRLNFEGQELRDRRPVFDQNGSDFYYWRHSFSARMV
jgi:hypothetical protein